MTFRRWASSWRRSDLRPFAKSDPFGRTSPRTIRGLVRRNPGKTWRIKSWCFRGKSMVSCHFPLQNPGFSWGNPWFSVIQKISKDLKRSQKISKDLKSTFLLAKSIFYWWKPWRVLTTLNRLLAISLGLTARSLFVIMQQLNASSTRSMKTQFMLDNINFCWL